MKSLVWLLSLALFLGSNVIAATSSNAKGAATGALEGKVVETMDAAGYTYFLVDTGAQKVWVAVTQVALKVGDRVSLAEAMPMKDYHSKTLNRTFDVVYFASSVMVNGKPAAGAAPAAASGPAAPAVDLKNIQRATGGQTVAEIYAGQSKLAGKKVTVRGRVVKYNGGIMGKNWVHIRDGSGSEGTNDLTVTTQAKTRVGDLIVITGVLAANRDFGGGYKYPVIVEDANLVVE